MASQLSSFTKSSPDEFLIAYATKGLHQALIEVKQA
jgi:hypothetical protein